MNASRRSHRSLAITRSALVMMLAGAFALWFLAQDGSSQDAAKKAPPAAATPPSATSGKAVPEAAQIAMPDAERIILLVRTTLLTLNDALQTGNFTVLRDVAAPSFSQANSAARLASIFGNLVKQGVDLGAVAIIMPQLAEAPALDQQNKMLRLKGFFPGQPVRIDFDVIYQAVDGRWRLFGLSVQPTNVGAVAGASPAVPTTAPEPRAKKAGDSKDSGVKK